MLSISCFNLSYVPSRDLSSNKLNGPIPPILGNLTYTEKLYLHGNKLTGSIPPELGNMLKLHYLELNDNQLTGHIPPELIQNFAGMLLITTLKDHFPIILAHVQISTALM